MSRERMTQRREAKSIIAEIDELERRLEAMDEDQELKKETDELAKEEVKIVSEGTDVPVSEGEDQNEKSMENWLVEKREAIASRLIKMAQALLDSEEQA